MIISVCICHEFRVLGFFSLDPNEDQFEKQSKERAEKIAKNEYQRLSNISIAQKGKRLKGLSCLCYLELLYILNAFFVNICTAFS